MASNPVLFRAVPCTLATSCAMLGFCIRSRSFRLKPWALSERLRAITCRLRIESPPSSKKLSVTPTRSIFSTCCQIVARAFSSSVTGAT
ncbi:hypothetical protein D3C80_1521590 [compost metagenome]